MKRILLTITAAATMFTGSALAAPFVLDDSGVDYGMRSDDTDVEVAYMTLGMDGGRLVVSLDDAQAEGALPAIDFVIPDLDREDLFGEEFNADLSNIAEVRRVDAGRYAVSLDVTHPSVSVRELANAYADSLEGLGYAVQVSQAGAGKGTRIVAEHADGILRIQLTPAGYNVRAHFAAY